MLKDLCPTAVYVESHLLWIDCATSCLHPSIHTAHDLLFVLMAFWSVLFVLCLNDKLYELHWLYVCLLCQGLLVSAGSGYLQCFIVAVVV